MKNEKKKEFTIYVNGEQKVVTSKHITYSEIVALDVLLILLQEGIFFLQLPTKTALLRIPRVRY